MTFGEYLKARRIALGWTQPEAASRIQIEQSYLSKLETSKAYPSDEVFQRLLSAYLVQAEEILADLSPDEVERLSDIEMIKHLQVKKTSNDKSESRQWLIAGVCALAVGGALLGLARLDRGGVVPQYSYQSKGVILPGESLDVFADIGETADEAAPESETRNAKRDALIARLDDQTQYTRDFRGPEFVADVTDGKRVWRLVGGTNIQTPDRFGWANILGFMFSLVGLGCFFVSWRWPHTSSFKISKR
jgi:transcriptional regulator with XRE-family HTH domain